MSIRANKTAKGRLVARQNVLKTQLKKIETNLRHEKNPLEKDSQERAQALENEEVLDALDDAGRLELEHIRRALELLDRGEYGTCARCGELIDAARLNALPHAAYCIACAEEGRR